MKPNEEGKKHDSDNVKTQNLQYFLGRYSTAIETIDLFKLTLNDSICVFKYL